MLRRDLPVCGCSFATIPRYRHGDERDAMAAMAARVRGCGAPSVSVRTYVPINGRLVATNKSKMWRKPNRSRPPRARRCALLFIASRRMTLCGRTPVPLAVPLVFVSSGLSTTHTHWDSIHSFSFTFSEKYARRETCNTSISKKGHPTEFSEHRLKLDGS